MKPHPLVELAVEHLSEGAEGLVLSDAGLEVLVAQLKALDGTPGLVAGVEGLYTFADFLMGQGAPPAGMTLLGLVASACRRLKPGADAELIATRAEQQMAALIGKAPGARTPVGSTPPVDGAQRNDPALRFRLLDQFKKR